MSLMPDRAGAPLLDGGLTSAAAAQRRVRLERVMGA
jgi:hypothetical protein